MSKINSPRYSDSTIDRLEVWILQCTCALKENIDSSRGNVCEEQLIDVVLCKINLQQARDETTGSDQHRRHPILNLPYYKVSMTLL